MPLSQARTKLLRRLADNRARAREGRVLVEGVRAVGAAIDGGAAAPKGGVSFAVVSPRLDATEDGRELRRRLATVGLEVVEVTDVEIHRVADTEHPQGVVLVCPEPETTLESVRSAAGAAPRVLVLDAVQDPGNVGTLVRSAVAFGFDAVVALDGTADPWSAKAVRASAGTAFRISVTRASADETLSSMSAMGLPILVASAEGSAATSAPPDGFALVLGNEGAGVRESVRAMADRTIGVVMTGPAESLNVGIAGSILMFDLTKAAR